MTVAGIGGAFLGCRDKMARDNFGIRLIGAIFVKNLFIKIC